VRQQYRDFFYVFVRPGRLLFKRDLSQEDLAFWVSMIFSENRYPLFGIMLQNSDLRTRRHCRWRPQAGAYDPGLGSHRIWVLILDRRQLGYELLATPA